ncbi:sensor histidine kinase [Vibrio superstes]|uniref:histidine kinase n=1 Tax=Vibrio superstes NBRC 103154 TaxID=1219062 RepID=A0A511QP94_9VIBR|nr:HAMP domain-containing sensor histidine kinase [Vibrio superstes]GEM79140.1 two-component sensor histidine kinase [Vibrio superstes NBRC 103154]
MTDGLFSNTKTLTGRLALFFMGMSCVVGVMVFLIFYAAVHWSEDRVGERRIAIDRDSAVERFLSGEQGKIRLDALTVAYNDLSLVPSEIQDILKDEASFLGEIEDLSYMALKGQYSDKGQSKDIVLISQFDSVEFGNKEVLLACLVVLGVIILLMAMLGLVLSRLSKRLIEPLNDITNQLNHRSGNTERAFAINQGAADEFQLLTSKLNQYRSDLNYALKREQAFARYSSHELRTPLTVVKGANKLLSRSEHTELQGRQINRIEDATVQMTTMVDALLSIVRYERQQEQTPQREISEIEINNIIDSNAIKASEKDIEVEVEFVSAPKLRATNAVLNMVLGNLVRNAIAATAQGKLSVRIEASSISLVDDGVGLEGKQDSEGHGLGLMIVNDLCSRYQWQFKLSDHPTRGSVAEIIF